MIAESDFWLGTLVLELSQEIHAVSRILAACHILDHLVISAPHEYIVEPFISED